MEQSRRMPLGTAISAPNNGIHIDLVWSTSDRGWAVGYPIIHEGYMPGQMVQWGSMPLIEFLNMLADEYKLPHVFIANVD